MATKPRRGSGAGRKQLAAARAALLALVSRAAAKAAEAAEQPVSVRDDERDEALASRLLDVRLE